MKPLHLLAALFACATLATAQQAAVAPNEYVRFAEHEEGDSLETAVARFESPKGQTVDLIGAVHVADQAYFVGLNARSSQYDVVLSDHVGPQRHDDPT